MPCLQQLGVMWESEPGLVGWAPALVQHPELQQLHLTCFGVARDQAQHQHQHQSEQPAWSGLQLSSCPKLHTITLHLRGGSVQGLLAELGACPCLQELELRGFYDSAIAQGDMQALARSRTLCSLKLSHGLALEALAPLLAPGACGLQLLEAKFELPGEVAGEARAVMEEHFCTGTPSRPGWRGEHSGSVVGGDAGCAAAAAAAMAALRCRVARAVQEGLGLGGGELQVESLDLECEGCDRTGAMQPLFVSLKALVGGCRMKLRASCQWLQGGSEAGAAVA